MTIRVRGVFGALSVCLAASGAASAQEGAAAQDGVVTGAAESRAAGPEDEGLEVGRRGLVYSSENFELNLGGRLHLDAAQIDDAGVETEDEEIRRARLELSVRFFDDWRLRVDREFTNGGAWRNVWLSYDVSDDFTIKAGNFIAPFSMEDVGSSNETMFMERSLAQALAPGFGLGAGLSYEGRRFGVAAGYFGDAFDPEDDTQAEKGQGVAARATWSPIERRRTVLHFGVGLEHREFDAGDTRLISSRPESSLAPIVVTTGPLANLDTSTSYNVEAAYSGGPVLIQGQFISSELKGAAGADVSLNGYYAQIGWIITGERHRYGDAAGVFTGPNPRSAWGALEFAARVSALDLSEAAAVASGEVHDATFGVNWYIGRNFRLMANYVHSEVDSLTPLLDRDVEVIQARAQIDF